MVVLHPDGGAGGRDGGGAGGGGEEVGLIAAKESGVGGAALQFAGNLAELAAQVDRRMRELAGHAVTADTGKLAILVALNLADELSRREQQAAGERSEIEMRVMELAERLEEVLKV